MMQTQVLIQKHPEYDNVLSYRKKANVRNNWNIINVDWNEQGNERDLRQMHFFADHSGHGIRSFFRAQQKTKRSSSG
eukprot:10275175-Ditylum_brightwellii.AAC.1